MIKWITFYQGLLKKILLIKPDNIFIIQEETPLMFRKWKQQLIYGSNSFPLHAICTWNLIQNKLSITAPNHKVPWTVLSISLKRNGSRQDNMVWRKKMFPELLTTSKFKHKATQTLNREEKTCEKLKILIEKSKILKEWCYYVGNYPYIYVIATILSLVKGKVEMHGKLLLQNFSSCSLFYSGC